MAHHITDGMISFNAKTPWHGLGTRVDSNATPEEMLKAANMDWQVQLRSIAVSTDSTNPATNETIALWKHDKVKDFKAVVRMDTKDVFSVVSDRYKPVQNIEVARFFHDYAEAGLCRLAVIGALDGGKKIWSLAEVDTNYTITSKNPKASNEAPDVQLGYVMLATSHDGSLRTVAMGTSIYVVCWNTMSAALSEAGLDKTGKGSNPNVFSLKHSGTFGDSAKRMAVKTVGLVKEQLHQTADMASEFASMQLDGRGRIEFVRRLIGGESILEQIANDEQLATQRGSLIDQIANDQDTRKPEETRLGKSLIDAIINSPGNHLSTRDNTMWGAINGVTYFADHQRGRTDDSTLNGAWFGEGARLKAQAVNVAYDMSGAKRQVA